MRCSSGVGTTWRRRNPLRLTHLGCGAEATVEIRCAEGHLVPPEELGMRLVKAAKG